MALWDYHTHHARCKHAEGQIEDYVKTAINAGLVEIGISDHFPMDLLPEEANVWQYAMAKEEFPKYIAEVKVIQERYAGKIRVKVAAELDYFAPVFPVYKKAVEPFLPEFDYVLGSVHVIGPWEGTDPFGVDDDIGMDKCKQFTADKVYLEYYRALEGMVKSKLYNIVGHLDLPKKFGVRPEHPEKVHESALHLLDIIKKSSMSVEINTAGFLKPIHEQYPSEVLLKEIIARKIPMNLGSDSHNPKNVAQGFSSVMEILKKYGCTKLCQWNKRKSKLVSF